MLQSAQFHMENLQKGCHVTEKNTLESSWPDRMIVDSQTEMDRGGKKNKIHPLIQLQTRNLMTKLQTKVEGTMHLG